MDPGPHTAYATATMKAVKARKTRLSAFATGKASATPLLSYFNVLQKLRCQLPDPMLGQQLPQVATAVHNSFEHVLSVLFFPAFAVCVHPFYGRCA